MYYTNKEARRVLGNISSSTFRNFVESGIIHKQIPPGGKNGRYLKSEVDALAAARRKFFHGEKQQEGEDGIRIVNGA